MMFLQRRVTDNGTLSFTATLILGIIMTCHMMSSVKSQPVIKRETAPNRRYCSQALFEAIRIICDGRYNSLAKKYPDSFGNFRTSTLKRLLPDDDDVMYRPSYTGASNECCRRPCGYAELSSYCA